MTVRIDGLCYGIVAALLVSICACDTSTSASSVRSASDEATDVPTTSGQALSVKTQTQTQAPANDNHEPRSGLCEHVCAHTAQLACSAHAACAASCAEMHSSVQACAPRLEAFLRCLLSRPLTDFECDDDGVASVKDGPCDHEQGAVAQCLVSTPAES